MKKILASKIFKLIREHFSFIFEKGYTFLERDSYFENSASWKVVLASAENLILIYSDRDEIFLAFAPADNNHDVIGIEPMIYFISQGKTFVSWFEGNLAKEKKRQFERLAGLLKEYDDQILPYFRGDYERYRNKLVHAQKEYNDLFLEKHTQK